KSKFEVIFCSRKLRRRRSEARLCKNVVPLHSAYCKDYSALSEKYRVYAQTPYILLGGNKSCEFEI
ncbi:hypothetical protein, partial [Bathymodiolus platifrons methanotrophic gill symbiont]|uniref:hypothetical protein n=1 Tax=Bathymodiolus platifrons methanotrophic gill symbiont TaxID=113268 RepID=UPI001C8D06A2